MSSLGLSGLLLPRGQLPRCGPARVLGGDPKVIVLGLLSDFWYKGVHRS